VFRALSKMCSERHEEIAGTFCEVIRVSLMRVFRAFSVGCPEYILQGVQIVFQRMFRTLLQSVKNNFYRVFRLQESDQSTF
jgi:hypothetical protein